MIANNNFKNKRMKKVKIVYDKFCRVCGDKAQSFNFNGLTCESCKAFFRRNAFDDNILECRNEGFCSIEKSTRKHCRKCRLEKCFAIGMRKELIFRQKSDNSPQSDNSSSTINSRHVVDWSQFISSVSSVSSSLPSPLSVTTLSPSSTSVNCDLTEYERDRLDELTSAMSSFIDESQLPNVGEIRTLIELLNIPGFNIKQVIKFCKSLPAFQCIKQSDQLIMLKCFFTEQFLIRSAFLYCVDRDGFHGLENESGKNSVFVPMEIWRQCTVKHEYDLYSIFKTFVHALHDEMDNDTTIRNLILVQSLFKQRDNSNLTCPEYISYHHNVYCYLLRRYFEQKYNTDTEIPVQKYASLMAVLSELDYLAEVIKDVYRNVEDSTRQLEHVLIEIYNLN